MIGSYFEWVQNIQGYPWDRETVLGRLEKQLDGAYESVTAGGLWRTGDLRLKAYEVAIGRALDNMEQRGF